MLAKIKCSSLASRYRARASSVNCGSDATTMRRKNFVSLASFTQRPIMNGSTSHHATEPSVGSWLWSLSIGASLELGAWNLELFTSIPGYRLVQVENDAANLRPRGQLGGIHALRR